MPVIKDEREDSDGDDMEHESAESDKSSTASDSSDSTDSDDSSGKFRYFSFDYNFRVTSRNFPLHSAIKQFSKVFFFFC